MNGIWQYVMFGQIRIMNVYVAVYLQQLRPKLQSLCQNYDTVPRIKRQLSGYKFPKRRFNRNYNHLKEFTQEFTLAV